VPTDAGRLAGALCAGACLRLDRPGVAEQSLGLQSDGLAVAGCGLAVVDHRGHKVQAVRWRSRAALVLCITSIAALQPDHRTELAHQAAGSTDPANAGTSLLHPLDKSNLDPACDYCIFVAMPWPGIGVLASPVASANHHAAKIGAMGQKHAVVARGRDFDLSNGRADVPAFAGISASSALMRQLSGGDQAEEQIEDCKDKRRRVTSPTLDLVALDDRPRASTTSNCQAIG